MSSMSWYSVTCLLHTFVISNEMEEYRDRSERAAAASEAKTAFLSNMSHELRTPINAVLGMNEMVLRVGRLSLRSTHRRRERRETFRLSLIKS